MGNFKKRALIYIILFIAVPVGGVIYFASQDGSRADDVAWSFLSVAAFAILVLIVLEATSGSTQGPRDIGYAQVALGADGRLSTSKTITAAWTMFFAEALVLLTVMTFLTSLSSDEAFGGDWNQYFLLLGGPFAAAIAAKGITMAQIAKDPSSKTNTTAQAAGALPTDATSTDTPKAKDLLTNDDGETSLVDTQFAIFTLAAIMFFVGTLFTNCADYADLSAVSVGLPAIPSALLGLTSLSALTYVGNKAL